MVNKGERNKAVHTVQIGKLGRKSKSFEFPAFVIHC